MRLVSLAIDGRPLEAAEYAVGPESLTIFNPPASFTLEVVTELKPQENTSLEGLYRTSGNFCTQCEAEGFRKITYFLDRPDVMARYRTTITADALKYPVLLSNGNLVAASKMDHDGRHTVTWEDPFAKPCYLFALVAGVLVHVEDTYVTRSGRTVTLRIYVEPGNQDKCDHAMRSLKKSMAWDEEVYGLEYDLDIFMIVAVGDFNMGAMENKGLNVFNTKYVLARPESATDTDFLGVEAVVAHEYFHNWTGNRVTCRDWFQLSLKEGLTVFRDQEFSSDMNSRPVKRIADVQRLRASQFPEDSGPMAHPVRPDSYIEINNFYTTTVYEKGAEVVRMIHTLLGPQGFRKGIDLYFQRHDGQAVTCDDFVAAMEDATGKDLGQFRRWYSQAGTPELDVSGEYDGHGRTYRLTVRQSCPPSPGQPVKQPFHIPLALGLLDHQGDDIPLRLAGEDAPAGDSRVLDVTEAEQVFEFVDVPAPPVPSLLRGFSAPVKLRMPYTDDDLTFLMAHDSDAFNRWEAGQTLGTRLLLDLVADRAEGQAAGAFGGVPGCAGQDPERSGARPCLRGAGADPAVGRLSGPADAGDRRGRHPRGPQLRQEGHRRAPAGRSAGDLPHPRRQRAVLDRRRGDRPAQPEESGARLPDEPGGCRGGRTLRRPVPQRPCHDRRDRGAGIAERHPSAAARRQRWPASTRPGRTSRWWWTSGSPSRPCRSGRRRWRRCRSLLAHPAFEIRNPNKVYALIGGFAGGNAVRFHDRSGAGYEFLADQVLTLNGLNPQVASRMVKLFARWRKYDDQRQALMRAQLERIVSAPNLSPDVFEIASKSLAAT